MLTEKQVKEIKEHLNCAQNPIFFFDNDTDGLCSFLLLRRYLGRGKGVAVKSFPDLGEKYFRKVEELNADYIFILDKPVVSHEFFEKASQVNIPVVWIDHHKIDFSGIPCFVNYYNPVFEKKKLEYAEPVTALCYQITQQEKDLWFAVAGCIADSFFPSFYSEFEKKYPDLSFPSKNAFNIYYKSQIGKIAHILNFALKDRTTNVVKMLKFLTEVGNPYEVLEKNSKNRTMHQKFEYISKRIEKLVDKVKKNFDGKNRILFFQYSGDLSVSADLANKLYYLFPEKIIVVAYLKAMKANISVRGKNIRAFALKAIENLEGATGGGHRDAVGAKVMIEDFEKFKKKFRKLVCED